MIHASSPSKRLEDLSLVQRERLVDFRLYFFGEIGRPDLIERFGVAPAGATRDLALYRKLRRITSPSMVATRFIASGGSSPLFEHASLRVLSALSLGLAMA
jgi:hypothetical protein